DHRKGQDRTDRRREDLRQLARAGRANPHRRNGRERALVRTITPNNSIARGAKMKRAYLKKWGQTALAGMGTLALSTGSALAAAPKIDSGDTAWMLTSSALVLLMTIPGLALFYGGMVRKKNVLATLAQSFGATCIITVLWMIIGYSIAFTNNP